MIVDCLFNTTKVRTKLRQRPKLLPREPRLHGRNHLEEPAVRVNPDLGAVLAAARAEFGDVTLAGSGSTLFIEGHHGLGSTWLTDVGELQVCETVTA